eukprot:g1855.t1
MRDDGGGEPAPSPSTAAAEEEEEAVQEALPPAQPAQQLAVPDTADGDEEVQAAVTPDANPDPTPESLFGQPVSPSSPVAAPPAPTPTPNLSPRVVDLREVKKVKPGPLASSAAAPVPADDDSDGPEQQQEEEGAGPVKIDISAGKRMIEFQLKQNAAEERREAARLKGEKERADAAAAAGSQRMLAQVNARIAAQRRAGGGVLGSWGGENLADGDGSAVHGLGQGQIRNLAENHGIVVRFVDDGAASGVAQVRALARAHGIRIKILGQDDGGGGVDREEGGALPGGDDVDKAATPPPILSSLRNMAAPARRSPSPVPVKASPRKTPAAPAAGIFSGPARMMRRALEASGGCVPLAKDASPEASRGEPTSLKPSPAGARDGDEASTSSGSKGGVVRPEPGSAESAVGVRAASNGAVKGGVVAGSARSGGESCNTKGESVEGNAATAPAAVAAPGSSAPNGSGRKRREAPGDTREIAEKERKGRNDAGPALKRAVGGGGMGGGGGGGAVGGRMEGRLGNRNASAAGDEGESEPSAHDSKEVTTPRIQNGAPKRMRLVAPGGMVVSQASDPPSTQRSGRRSSSGGTAWGPGNNNLFKGAMAGIMGRGKRPAP